MLIKHVRYYFGYTTDGLALGDIQSAIALPITAKTFNQYFIIFNNQSDRNKNKTWRQSGGAKINSTESQQRKLLFKNKKLNKRSVKRIKNPYIHLSQLWYLLEYLSL